MAFLAITALDLPGMRDDMNTWIGHSETALSELHQGSLERFATLESSINELRGEIMMFVRETQAGFAATSARQEQLSGRALLQPDELQQLADRIIRLDQAQQQQNQTGNSLVSQLQDQFTLRNAKQDSVDSEMRHLAEQIQVKFIELETVSQQFRQTDHQSLQVAFDNLTARLEELARQVDTRFVAVQNQVDAPRGPTGQDPWWGQSAGPPTSSARQIGRFDLTTADTPPGFAEPSPQTGWTDWTANSWRDPNWRSSGHGSEFRVDTRNWRAANLDLDTRPEGFDAWQNRALAHLSGNRLDVRRLLDWAEKHSGPIDAAAEQLGARAA